MGGGRGFLGGDLNFFGKGQGGFTKIFDRRKGWLLIFFLHLLRKEYFFSGFFNKRRPF